MPTICDLRSSARSDEFTVPLCRTHHTSLHQRGDELVAAVQRRSTGQGVPAVTGISQLHLSHDRNYASLDICQGICHLSHMTERHVKLFKNGRNQAVRIPREFELPGEDAIIRKEGQRLIIEAAPPRSLLAVLATLPTLDDDFPPIEDLPPEPVDF
jgi:antitoxin VapB